MKVAKPLELLPRPAPELLQELLALQTLQVMQLTSNQLRIAATWIERVNRLEVSSGGDMLVRTQRAIALLQQVRDRLTNHQPIPESLFDELSAEQAAQARWLTRRNRYLQNAAQALLGTLCAEQKKAMIAPQPGPQHLVESRVLIQEAAETTSSSFPELKASIARRYPRGAGQIQALLEVARGLTPLDLARQLNTLALKAAEVLVSLDPADDAQTASEPALAAALLTMLQYPSIQVTILKAALAASVRGMGGLGELAKQLPREKNERSSEGEQAKNDIEPGEATEDDAQEDGVPEVAEDTLPASDLNDNPPATVLASPLMLDDLLRAKQSLQQQIEIFVRLCAMGFSRPQIETSIPWLQKADSLRKRTGNSEHDIISALSEAIDDAARAVAHGQEPPIDADANSDELNAAVHFQQQNLRNCLLLAAQAMVADLPRKDLVPLANEDSPMAIYDRVLTMLQDVRSLNLSDYLTRENDLVQELLTPTSLEGAADRIKETYRQVRLMTDAEFLLNEASLLRTLVNLVQPSPAAPVPSTAAGPATTPAVQDTEPQDSSAELRLRASNRILDLLSGPGLSAMLGKASTG